MDRKVPSNGTRDDLLAELERLREQVASLLLRAERAEALAERDVLVPVLNRRGMISVLARQMAYCRRHEVQAVLLYLDLDGFKATNDTLGHAAGDAALMAVAEVLLSQVRASDAVGRLGGDEFAILMMNASYDDGCAKAVRLSDALARTGFVWNDLRQPVAGSFGVSALMSQPDAESWLAEADSAMWLNKPRRRR